MSPGRSSQSRPLALVGGTLIDGTGSAPLRDSVVLIRGERIEKIGTTVSLPVPNGYEAVSTEGLTVLPGLWDLHVHLMYAGHPDPRHWFDTYTPQFERVIRDRIRNGPPLYRFLRRSSQDEINAIVKHKIAQIGSSGFTKLGMNPMSVIRAMTLDAARVIGGDHDSRLDCRWQVLQDVIARTEGTRCGTIGVLREPRIVIKQGRRFR